MLLPVLLFTCVALDGDRILARHLAQADPAFASLPPETVVGHAPQPGLSRTLSAAELTRLAQQHHVALEHAENACFQWSTQAVTAEAIEAAMRATLGPEAQLEIQNWSRTPLPAGTLNFPLSGLTASTWRGYLETPDHQRFPFWARVTATVPVNVLTLTQALKAGEPITAEAVTADTQHLPPTVKSITLEETVGRTTRRTLNPGTRLTADLLAAPKEVDRGDTVQVDVQSGRAHLQFEAKAQSAGALGEQITIINPISKRTFPARVVGRKRVLVTTGPESAE